MTETTYSGVHNLVYSSPDNTSISMIVEFDKSSVPVRFNACPNDPMDYGRELYERAVAGDFGPIQKYVPPAPASLSKEQCKQAVENILDKKAKEYGFNSMLFAASYCGFPNEYQDVAVKLAKWRSKVWIFVEGMLHKFTPETLTIAEFEKLTKNIPKFTK
jgi:hypothetical protein